MVRKHLLPIFKDQIEEGATYVMEKFMVAQNDPTSKTTDHKNKLSFMAETNFFKVRVPRLKVRRIGVFGTRSAHHPGPIGITVAKVSKPLDMYPIGLY
ncbi:DUF223 domain protein [Medicago truncatula]|uniref:DUF223 domain protein n=1 Tax=Medicago truncatula TaxID=3880 RepID=A0A072UI40_MEDTR|nr:DUF223 domain protein [Medicago truncatula]